MTRTDTDDAVGRALAVVRDGVATLSQDQWEAPSLCEGWSVKDAVAHLVWRVSASSREMLDDIARASFTSRQLNPSRAMAEIARSIAQKRTTAELIDDLTLISRRISTGDQRGSSPRLLETIVHGYDAAHPVGLRLRFDNDATFTVATLARRTASRSVRTLLRHRVLAASDAGWTIGRGEQQIDGTAESIILYLTGRRSIDPSTRPVRIIAPVQPGSPSPGFA
ncbi:maleylpyruvate isomerase family mycothiol-dependent enzyme [Paramicrobacterium chengjingii]|uniref:Maleylpyruvate isomerase family mycothiol-dependent enzyme n=1 Tax=Paramicrobacterium chengjingii TaxID=2769067 RepID=A0ABX6YEK2_9MICO|nr:maleylpyruvate isomerase family mycothiol-dependent enzyme [Microbacterium chengjingii]QPZ37193.1 maleylpyruvate isomerase family mycothiol-dependent enzyme [Microbacterium chengjingii]